MLCSAQTPFRNLLWDGNLLYHHLLNLYKIVLLSVSLSDAYPGKLSSCCIRLSGVEEEENMHKGNVSCSEADDRKILFISCSKGIQRREVIRTSLLTDLLLA